MEDSHLVLQTYIRRYNAQRAVGRQRMHSQQLLPDISVHAWKKRKEVVHELVESENTYHNKLTLTCTHFLLPLSSLACNEIPLLSMSDVRSLFSCIVEIKNISCSTLEQLNREKARNPNVCSVGTIFTHHFVRTLRPSSLTPKRKNICRVIKDIPQIIHPCPNLSPN